MTQYVHFHALPLARSMPIGATAPIRGFPIAKTIYAAGTTLFTLCGAYYHYGIADGNGGVIHARKKEGVVHDTSLKNFGNGGIVKIDSDITSDDLCAAHKRALEYIGKPYDLFSDNCEHFVRCAHGLKKESIQLQRGMIIAVSVIAGIAIPQARGVAIHTAVGALNDDPIKGALEGLETYQKILLEVSSNKTKNPDA